MSKDGSNSITRFRGIASRMIERDDPAAGWFAAALQEYESGAPHGLTVGRAFEFPEDRREAAWWKLEAIERRGVLLREIRRRHFPHLSVRRAADKIATAAAHYRLGRWAKHRDYIAPPAGADPLTVGLHALMRLQEQLVARAPGSSAQHDEPRAPAPGFSTVRAALANEGTGCDSQECAENAHATRQKATDERTGTES